MRSLTPQQYDELDDSYDADPPIEERLKQTNELLADLLALLYTVHRDTEQHPEPYSRADFLPDPDEEPDDDEPEAGAEPGWEAYAHPMAFHPGRITPARPMRGHGSRPPAAALAAFQEANADGEG